MSVNNNPPAPAFVTEVIARVRASGIQSDGEQPVLVGYSGGVDSTVLLHALIECFSAEQLVAVHVNHQLQAAADDWSRHCADTAAQWGVPFIAMDAHQPPSRFPGGLENWARDQRRRLFAEAATRSNASTLVLAHHADDQAETVLMNLARGSGPVGLAGMPMQRQRDGLNVVRPLLNLPKTTLVQYVEHFGLPVVLDPSNSDVAMTRNRMRQEVIPTLNNLIPGFSNALQRTADNARDVMQALESLLFGETGIPKTLSQVDLAQRNLAVARQMLQLWLRANGLRSTHRGKLDQMMRQLVHNKSPYAQIRHDGHEVCRYRDRIEVRRLDQRMDSAAESVCWRGEEKLYLPAFRGWLHVVPVDAGEPGISADWLTQAELTAQPLQMSARIKPAHNRPTRRIKQLCQEAGIARWVRTALPMLMHGESLVYAAPFGLHMGFGEVDTGTLGRVRFEWVQDP